MSKKKNIDTVILTSTGGLIAGHLDPVVPLSALKDKNKTNPVSSISNGLFDNSSANYNTYYPEVTAEHFMPKDSEIVNPLVRALSEVIVHKSWYPVDFSQNEVLKKSLNLLTGQSIFTDHETTIANALGSIKEVIWEESYTAKDGTVIPSGINARLNIDGVSNPRIVRLLNMDPPGIHSLSVTVRFAWEPSHKNIPLEEFMGKLGEFDENGKMYTRQASEILSYSEISFVNHGADAYAQVIRDGELTNPKYADRIYNSENTGKVLKHFDYNFQDTVVSNSAQKPTIPVETNNNNSSNINSEKMKEILALMAASLGYTPTSQDETEQLTEATTALKAHFDKFTTDSAALTAAQGKVTRLESEIAELKKVEPGKVELTETQKANIANGELLLKERKAELTRLAEITNKSEKVANLIKEESTNLEAIDLMVTSLQEEADDKFPLTCTQCNSEEVTRASAKPNPPGSSTKGPKLSLRDKVKQKQMQASEKMHSRTTETK